MIGFQYLAGTLADDDAGSHCVAGCHARHDGTIRDAKIVYSIDLEVTVHDGHGIASHLSGARLMGESRGGISNEVLKIGAFKIARHDFAFHVTPKRCRISDFAADFNAKDHCFHIVWVGQTIVMNLYRIERFWASQADMSPALWLHYTW